MVAGQCVQWIKTKMVSLGDGIKEFVFHPLRVLSKITDLISKPIDKTLFRRWSGWQGVLVQLVLTIAAFAVITILVTSLRSIVLNSGTGYRDRLWGLKQASTPAGLCSTVDRMDDMSGKNISTVSLWMILVMSFAAWLLGTVVLAFLNGVIVNWYNGRRELVAQGHARYRFSGHGIIIGWDFQGVASVLALLDQYECREVVILSEQFASSIRNALDNELGDDKMKKIYICNGSVGVAEDLKGLWPEYAKVVIVLGDQNETNNDGGNMRIASVIRRYVIGRKSSRKKMYGDHVPLNILVDVANHYNFQFYEVFPTEVDKPEFYDGGGKSPVVHVRIMNFFKASVAELYSSFRQFPVYNEYEARKEYAPIYYPLAFRRNPEASHVHLIFTGLTDMTRAAIVQLIPILCVHPVDAEDAEVVTNKVTVFYDSTQKDAKDEWKKFQRVYPFKTLHNVEVEFVDHDICDAEVQEELGKIARDMSASVTLFVVNPKPDAALEMFNLLPDVLRYENIRVLVEQRILAKWAPSIRTLNCTGFGKVDFFGFTDRYYTSFIFAEEVGKRSHEKHTEIADETDRLRIFRESLIYGLLENLSAHDLMLEYFPSGQKVEAEKTVFWKDIGTIRNEHTRNVNFKLLNGVKFSKEEADAFANISTELQKWDEVPEKRREKYAGRIKGAYDALRECLGESSFCTGKEAGKKNQEIKGRYLIVPRQFHRVLGVMPSKVWHAETLPKQLKVRIALLSELLEPLVEVSRHRGGGQAAGDVLMPPSLAIIVVPGFGITYDVCRIVCNMGIPLIVVLNKAADEYAKEYFPEERRENFWRLMRNAFTYYIVPRDTPEELAEFIVGHSDETLDYMLNGKVARDVSGSGESAYSWLPPKRIRLVRHVLKIIDEGAAGQNNFKASVESERCADMSVNSVDCVG